MTNDQREIHRKKRVIEYAEQSGNVTRTCRYFGVARSAFYLWRDRYRDLGFEGLRSRMCGAHNHPNTTPDEVANKMLHLRRTYYLGPIRIVWYPGATMAARPAVWERFYNDERPHGAHRGKTAYEALREKLR
jgi:hypothetical protein